MPSKRKTVGKIFLWMGIVAWIPYGIVKYGLGQELPAWPFLAWHLVGVIPGSLILRWDWIRALGGKMVAK
jgi:hypothetical protein